MTQNPLSHFNNNNKDLYFQQMKIRERKKKIAGKKKKRKEKQLKREVNPSVRTPEKLIVQSENYGQ